MCSACCMAASASSEFFKEGKVWYGLRAMLANDLYNPSIIYYHSVVKVDGDTIVNNTKYKKLIRYIYCEDGELSSITKFAVYEENSKVFVVDRENPSEAYEYCNFNLKLGEEPKYGIVEAIDTIVVNGVARKRWKIKRRKNSDVYAYLVEDIGFDNNAYWLGGIYVLSVYDLMLAVYEDGKCIFELDDFSAPSTTGIKNMETGGKAVLEDKIYDLSGKEVKVPKKGEVYIRNHKKFIQPGGNP